MSIPNIFDRKSVFYEYHRWDVHPYIDKGVEQIRLFAILFELTLIYLIFFVSGFHNNYTKMNFW